MKKQGAKTKRFIRKIIVFYFLKIHIQAKRFLASVRGALRCFLGFILTVRENEACALFLKIPFYVKFSQTTFFHQAPLTMFSMLGTGTDFGGACDLWSQAPKKALQTKRRSRVEASLILLRGPRRKDSETPPDTARKLSDILFGKMLQKNKEISTAGAGSEPRATSVRTER